MKNLKKILVAIVIVALMISSMAVLVATAEDEVYSGDLATAQEMLDAVPRDHVYYAREALLELHKYLDENPIDPATDGYDEFCTELYDISLRILSEYHNKLLGDTAADAKRADFELIYSLVEAFGIPETTPDPDGDETKYTTLNNIKTTVETMSLEYARVFYNDAKTAFDTKANNYLATSTQKLRDLHDHLEEFPISPLVAEYATFTESYNLLSLEITESIVAELNTLREKSNTEGATADDKKAYKERLGTLLVVVRDHNKDAPVDLVMFPDYQERFDKYVDAMVLFEFDQISFLYEDYVAKDFYEKVIVKDENGEPMQDENGNVVMKNVYDFPELARAAELSKVSSALSASSIPDTLAGYTELATKIKNEEAAVAAIKEQRRQDLADATLLEQFSLTNNIITNDYNDPSVTKYINHMHNSDNNRGQYKLYDSDNPKESYWNYYSLGSPNGSAYTEIYVRNKTNSNAIQNGFVMSFDFMVENTNPNGGHYSKAAFSLRYKKNDTGSIVLPNGSNVDFGPTLFTVEYDAATDAIKVYNTAQTPAIPVATVKYNVAAEGQWFNLMVTYDPVTRYGKLYIDYEEMFEIYYRVGKTAEDVLPSNAGVGEFRVSQSPAAWNNMNFDNFMKYEGTSYREVYKFTNMTDIEQFMYYVNFMTGDRASRENKYFCYAKAKPLVEFMEKEYADLPESEMTPELIALKDCVERFKDYDKNYYEKELLPELINEKTEEFATMVADLVEKYTVDGAVTVDSTVVDRLAKEIALINDFVTKYNDMIDKTDVRYTSNNTKLGDLEQKMVGCENIVKFVRAFTMFNRATTVASMQRRANSLAEVYKLARYDKAENRLAVANDSVVRAFEELFNDDGLTPSDTKYIDIFEYYALLPAAIAEQQKVENSSKIIKCIDLLLELEGYEDTEIFWSENREDVEFLISIIRDIVSQDNYDHSYAGVDKAIEQYELVDAYLYTLLQDDHIAIITAQLDRFKSSESYIEKRGICTYVSQYFKNNNNIDESLPAVQQLKQRLETYEAELAIFAEDFDEILERNTQYFIDAVNRLNGLTTYSEIKSIYDEALSYYYIMNVTDDDPALARIIEDAIAKFDDCDKHLAAIEANTELFLKAIADIDLIAGMGAKYEFRVLSSGAPYYEYLDMTYIEMVYGVTDAEYEAQKKEYERVTGIIEIYENLYEIYNRTVDSVNSVSNDAMQIVIALRADGVPAAVLAVMSQLMKR